MAIELITGRAGTPHVDSADVGALNAALFGEGAYILEGITAELVDANNVLVSAGEMLCEGRHVRITGAGETLTIDNGLSAYKRHDIIAAKYLRDEDGMESVALVVIKGEPDIASPQDPAMPSSGKVIDGASEAYWPLYRVVIDGLTPQAPVLIAEQQAVYTLGLGEEIPEGADLNDYKTPGVYRCLGNLLANNPGGSQEWYALFVTKNLADDTVRQEAIIPLYTANGWGAAEKYVRYINASGNIGTWLPQGGVDSIVAEGQSGDWYYIKYASGRCFLSGAFNPWIGTWTGMQTGLYGASYTPSLPFAVTKPHVVAQTTDDGDPWSVKVDGYYAPYTQYSIPFWLFSRGNAGLNFGFSAIVTGWWK